jgi:hypothetical protein
MQPVAAHSAGKFQSWEFLIEVHEVRLCMERSTAGSRFKLAVSARRCPGSLKLGIFHYPTKVVDTFRDINVGTDHSALHFGDRLEDAKVPCLRDLSPNPKSLKCKAITPRSDRSGNVG